MTAEKILAGKTGMALFENINFVKKKKCRN